MTRGRRGCWTCRIRHRKCDEQVPDCKECTDRHIECHGYDLDAPEWMADEALLQEELQRIKAAVKENFRRVKRVQNRRLAQATAQAAQASRAGAAARLKDDAVVASTSDSQARNTTFREAQYLVHYLDYIFPIQYTFYVDAPEEGGRGWLFFLLERSAPLRNAALTLSAFHQHISSPYRTENQEDELLNYHTKALQELRQIIGRREVGGFADSREEWLEFLAGGMFLISFEVFQGGTSNWEPHFNALVTVANGLKPSEFDFCPPDPSSPDFDFLRGMNTAQKFLLANLLWIDVLAPVSTGASPKLPYREWLDAGKIDISRVMGCQNSIMIAIGDLVAVDSKAGSMSTETLQESILELEKQIFDGMEATLEVESVTKQSTSVTRSVTHLFATSALVQLYTLASEYGLTAPDPHQAVLRVIEVLEQMPANISLRGTPWPLCVAGSMALPPQQQYFDDLLKGLLSRSEAGFTNCGTVYRIVKHAWKQREQYPDKLWSARHAMADMGVCAILI
ncbi:Zn(2)-C6 fungal-type domain-containing protein [Fusarium falciforme]|uniref:Zn(2)-C6 fungal-type domain-containing protein n=1 Tax=Fusarium falciforme TaxID=195108 RepID=UPI00230073B7|nr:Zn(2)-C6 fungal-type domain-containing protein [Fusarium falciforme]WAO93590.1 Zn(2)-C6 fungal-type domain-containing protein [Fusarium falciforme]